MSDYVFGYASLVGLRNAGAIPGRLRGYRRYWGVSMNNWEGGEDAKHWLDCEGTRPRIRVAYLDLREEEGSVVNGLVLPVDADRLAEFDAREINYRRIDVSEAFDGDLDGKVFTYVGLDAARERCQQGTAEGNIFSAATTPARCDGRSSGSRPEPWLSSTGPPTRCRFPNAIYELSCLRCDRTRSRSAGRLCCASASSTAA